MEAVIFMGLQASGKSSFYKDQFFSTHVRISLDLLRTRNRERRLMAVCLETQQPFVIDNTNPNPVTNVEVTALRRRVRIDFDLPMKGEYGQFVRSFVSQPQTEGA